MQPATRMRRPSWSTIAACAGSLLIGLLYVSPVLKDVARTGLDWPIWLDHPEGVSLTTYGKWWVLPPHRYLSDGSSGEFPVYVYYLSDSLINVIAEAGGWPPMTVQAVLYGPLLGFAFLLLNYCSIRAVLKDARVALVASLLLSFGASSVFFDRPDPVSGLSLNTVLHVPFSVISLATAQSLGWVLLLPCLSLSYLAYRGFSHGRAIAAGLSLALLFHAHTLTFVNAAAAQLAFAVLANLAERQRDRRYWIWLAALVALAGAFVVLAMQQTFPFTGLVALGGLALAATFAVDPNKRFYAWSYGAALLGVAPYLLEIAPYARGLVALQAGWSGVQMMAVGITGFALFFAAYITAAALGCVFTRDRSVMPWLWGLLAATAFLALNHLWHWRNHPYRFAIHMLFPLAILSALGLRDAPRRLAVPLGAWLAAVCLFDAGGLLLGRAHMVRFRVAESERAGFLASVRETTSREEGSGLRLLAPVELGYPRGVLQAAMLMNYSRIPSYVPDYRHVLWRERYHNRMGLFCFLFPGYPNDDYPFGRRACEEELEPDPQLGITIDPRLRSAILPVHRVAFAGSPAKPFSNFVKEASAHYGWPIVAQTDNAALARTDVTRLPGLARLAPGPSTQATLGIRVAVDSPGPHVVVLGGRRLAERAPHISLDGHELMGRHLGNWAVLETQLDAGSHALELPALAAGGDPEADYLYFAAVVHRDLATRYLGLTPTAETKRR